MNGYAVRHLMYWDALLVKCMNGLDSVLENEGNIEI